MPVFDQHGWNVRQVNNVGSASPWVRLADRAPDVGAWVLMYLTKYMGVDRYRAGLYMGPDEWLSAANFVEPGGVLRDESVSHWMPLPASPS